MIRTLDDLVTHTEQMAALEPRSAHRILLRSPECSPADMNRLRAALPDLPDSYLRLVARFDFEDIDIGMFWLSPTRWGGPGMADRLLAANSPANPLWPALVQHQLLDVGSYEADPLCLRAATAADGGEVFRLDTSCPPELPITRVAWNWEQVLLAAGRIDERRRSEERGQRVVADLLRSLKGDFRFTDEQLRDWQWFAEVALIE